MYSKKTIEIFRKPKFAGEVCKADASGTVGNPACGDEMHISIKVKGDKIQDIKFRTFGCIAAIASSETVCKLAKGKTLDEALKITKDDVANALGGLPPIKMHCSMLGIEALKKAIDEYRKGHPKTKGKCKGK
jgi:nitrogen fixation NifU-like protein